MPQLSRGVSIGVLSAVAVSLTFGAAQFAMGRDLSINPQDRLQQSMEDLATSGTAINRAAKTDRATGVAGSPAQSRTIMLRPQGQPDTSVLLRIPVAQAARKGLAPSLTKSPDRKMAVACEPMVSVLSEVAKLLQPGRCVT
ncbi:hypothetical protein [Bradyrhizobium sp. dw_411]|uniref:hypothetical protein n=1 Tax=Bradyrhizobium sp. dw_411 TaxID=2720082 RepID=UPI001BCD44D0|nr:hypothetical protein [Bradyrhizobium sp. dw_411]